MKMVFVAVALVMGLGTSVAFADSFMVDSVTMTMINDFTPIEVKDLPAAVQGNFFINSLYLTSSINPIS